MGTPQNNQSPPEQGPWNKYASSSNGSSSDSQPWTKYASSSDQAPWNKYSSQPSTTSPIDVSKSLFDPANKSVNADDYSAAYSAAHPSPPQRQKGFFRSAGEEVWNAVTSPFTSQPSGFIDEPMATAT